MEYFTIAQVDQRVAEVEQVYEARESAIQADLDELQHEVELLTKRLKRAERPPKAIKEQRVLIDSKVQEAEQRRAKARAILEKAK